MDLYAYVWGVIKYLLPAMLMIIAIWIAPNALLLIIAVIWVSASIIVSALSSDPDSAQKSGNF